jgi:hypothetical protein
MVQCVNVSNSDELLKLCSGLYYLHETLLILTQCRTNNNENAQFDAHWCAARPCAVQLVLPGPGFSFFFFFLLHCNNP